MAKFDAGKAVEQLEFDFTAYGGGFGNITEPSTGAVNGFFSEMRGMLKEVGSLQDTMKGIDTEDLDEDQITEQASLIDEATEGASKFQTRTIEALAVLCGGHREFIENPDDPDADKIEVVVGGSPAMEDLNVLPYRVLQAFSQWLMEEIKPKRTTPGTRR